MSYPPEVVTLAKACLDAQLDLARGRASLEALRKALEHKVSEVSGLQSKYQQLCRQLDQVVLDHSQQ